MILRRGFVSVRTQALVGTVGVDALLATGEVGRTLVDVDAGFPVVLQSETGPTLALDVEGTKKHMVARYFKNKVFYILRH